MEYRVVSGETIHALVDAVKMFIDLGWEPIGGVACTSHGSYRQAMILKD